MHIRTGDLVEVIAGREKGSTGRVLRVNQTKGRVVVQGLHMVTRNQRPNQLNPDGGQTRKEASVSISNVRLYSEEKGRGFRVGVRFVGQGDTLCASREEAKATFDSAPERVNKVRVFLSKGEVVGRVPAPERSGE